MKHFIWIILLSCLTSCKWTSTNKVHPIPGFVESPYWKEQVMYFNYEPNVSVHINAPSAENFDPNKPTRLMIFALPNTNRTHWCIGKMPMEGEDFRYQILHIGAQTRFIREHEKDYNFVTIYLEPNTRVWGKWRRAAEGRDIIIRELIAYLYNMFTPYQPQIELNGHSGGGSFIFGFMDGGEQIPTYVKRICFMDSNYNWTNERYGNKLKQWLLADSKNQLSVICYDDGNALTENGKQVIDPEDGTFHQSKIMLDYVKSNLDMLKWNDIDNDSCIQSRSTNKQIYFNLRKNPERKIYHSRLVELNGYIQSAFSNTKHEEIGYLYFKNGKRAYDQYRQPATLLPLPFRICPRQSSLTGSQFTKMTSSLKANERDSLAINELLAGNIPNSLRQHIYITDTLQDAIGTMHEVTFSTLPDYLAIGTDEDYIRIPLLPQTAQQIATHYGSTLPTRKLSALIHQHSRVKMAPQPMTPDATMVTMPVFARHDSLLNMQMKGMNIKPFKLLTAGHKKDISITNRIANEPNRLFIYGLHYPDGKAIQPLSGAHNNKYVDYSHGVRLISDEVLVDGQIHSLTSLLKDSILYKLFSDEDGPMQVTTYPL